MRRALAVKVTAATAAASLLVHQQYGDYLASVEASAHAETHLPPTHLSRTLLRGRVIVLSAAPSTTLTLACMRSCC